MAKKEKSVEKMRKGYKRRGIFYCAMIVLLVIATIVLNINGVEEAVKTALMPSSRILTLEGEKKEVFCETGKEDGVYVATYYVLNDKGEKQILNAVAKVTKLTRVETVFKSDAEVYFKIVKSVVLSVMVLFIVLLVIYLMRLSYFISNKDDEWKQQIGDKMLNLRVKKDKALTNISKKLSKKNK